MPAGIIGIDHPVIAVRDMQGSHRAYQRLGFTIPPLGSHLEWGTGNWCIMFPGDYLELRGIVDGSRYTHNLDKFLEEREGLMGVAFATRGSAESYATAKASGLAPTALKELTRRFALPEGDAFPKFRLVYLSEADAPGLLTSVICEHLTPELIRRPEWLTHANGVRAVLDQTTVVTDLAAARAAYERLFDPGTVSGSADRVVARPGRGATLTAMTPAAAEQAGLALPGAAPPYMPSLTLGVTDPERTTAVLRGNGVPLTREADGAVRVGPAETCGVIMRFVAG